MSRLQCYQVRGFYVIQFYGEVFLQTKNIELFFETLKELNHCLNKVDSSY